MQQQGLYTASLITRNHVILAPFVLQGDKLQRESSLRPKGKNTGFLAKPGMRSYTCI